MVISEFYFLTIPLLVKGKITPSSFCYTGAFVLFLLLSFFVVVVCLKILTVLCGWWDLSSLTRHQTLPTAAEV